MTNVENNIPVEQLWYTWSNVGVSTGSVNISDQHAEQTNTRGSFRVRAASSGLTEIGNERVKSMEPYLHYALPPGTNTAAITPDMAPIGLALFRSKWNNEYLLVHKKYTGKDGNDRVGNFFTHVLALGEHSKDFSTEDAIWLWKSSLWKTDSNELEAKDRHNTKLDALSIDKVYDGNTNFRSTHFQVVQNALQFIIAAYLMRKDRATPLYIAAPAGQEAKIATIIAGLTNCLPAQLLVNLTFSTYEPDIAKATTEIVGTSWISVTGTPDEADSIFPKHFYLEKLAMNCITQDQSNLQAHPQIEYNKYAADFAEFAAASLATGKVDRLYALRNDAENSQILDIALFLQLYHTEIVNGINMDEAEIEKYLNSDMRIDWLCRKTSRKKILDRVIANPSWGSQRLYDLLHLLQEQAQKKSAMIAQQANTTDTSLLSEEKKQVAILPSFDLRPHRGKHGGPAQAKRVEATLADALALLARSTIPEVVKRMEQASKLTGNMTPDRLAERQKLVDTITILLSLMDGCLLPQDPTEVWRQLFEEIVDNNKAIAFLLSNWAIHAWLLKKWNEVFLPDVYDDNRIGPLLIISWDHLGEFLQLGLRDRHKQWIISAIQEIVPTPMPTPQIALDLGQKYAREIGTLLVILAQERHYAIEAILIARLVGNGYPVSSGVEPHIEPLLDYLNRDNTLRRSAKDLILTLMRTGYSGTIQYQKLVADITQNIFKTSRVADQELIDAMIKYDFPQRSWIIDLLLTSSGNTIDVLQAIPYVYPTPAGQHAFFVQDGPRYLRDGSASLSSKHWAQPMLALYGHLLTFHGRLERLFILLDSGMYDPETISRVLTNTPLEGNEMERFLTRYGQSYLQNFQQSPKLARIIVSDFTQLIKAGYRNDLLFKIMPTQTGEIYLTLLLSAANLTTTQQISFLERYGVQYITLYPLMSLLMEYIRTYITHFHIDYLEKEEMKAFFTFLTQNHEKLVLEQNTQSYIKCWKIIDDYFTSPKADAQTMETLAQALSYLSLPDNAQFTEKLAQAFVSCIKTKLHLSTVTEFMKQVPKMAKEKNDEQQFLYILAKQAAVIYKRQMNINVLLPYLLFVLTILEQDEQFLHTFLEKLLYFIDANNSTMWRLLDTAITRQKLQYDEMERWHHYLKKIGYTPEKKYHIFVCYAREDQKQLEQLEKHLNLLCRQNIIDVWYDRDISAGTDWEKEININLNKADIILLLVSPDFMDSDYCYSVEMIRAMERHEQKKARVIPIILRPVYWEGAPFGKIQALPRDAKPIISSYWPHVDEAFYDVAEGIRRMVEELKEAEQAGRKS